MDIVFDCFKAWKGYPQFPRRVLVFPSLRHPFAPEILRSSGGDLDTSFLISIPPENCPHSEFSHTGIEKWWALLKSLQLSPPQYFHSAALTEGFLLPCPWMRVKNSHDKKTTNNNLKWKKVRCSHMAGNTWLSFLDSFEFASKYKDLKQEQNLEE